MDLDVILFPSSVDELVSGVDAAVEPLFRQLMTPSSSASIRRLAAAEHAQAVRNALEPWRRLLEEDDHDDASDDDNETFGIGRKLDAETEKRFREHTHWKHLAWTLDTKNEL